MRIAARRRRPVFNNTVDPALMDNGAGVSWDKYLNDGPEIRRTRDVHDHQPRAGPHDARRPAGQSGADGRTDRVGHGDGHRQRGHPLRRTRARLLDRWCEPEIGQRDHQRGGRGDDQLRRQQPGSRHDPDVPRPRRHGIPGATGPVLGSPTSRSSPQPPVPNSSYKVQSIKANADGTITIVFVPTQAGRATRRGHGADGDASRAARRVQEGPGPDQRQVPSDQHALRQAQRPQAWRASR